MKLFRQKDELFELMSKGRRAGPGPTPPPTAGPPLAARASSVAGKTTNATTGPTGTQRLGTRTTTPTPAPETPAASAPALTPAPVPPPSSISSFAGPPPTGVTSGLPALSNPPRLPQRVPPSIKPATPTTTTTNRRRSLSPALPPTPGTDSDLFDIDGDALVVVDDGWNEAAAVEGPERTFAIRADTAIVGGLLASGLLLTAFLVGRTTTTPEAPEERPIPQVTLVQPAFDPSNATSLPASVSNQGGGTASALTAGTPSAPPATSPSGSSSAPQAGFTPPTAATSPGKYEVRVVTTTPEKAKALAAWLNEAPRSPIFGRGDLQVVVNGGSVKIQGFMQREAEVLSRVRATSDPTGGSGTFHDAYFAAVKTFRVAREASNDDWTQRKVLNDVMRGLCETDWNRSPAEILSEAIGKARETFRSADPFAARRAEIHKELLPLAQEVRERVAASDDPFSLAVLAAAAANVVDELILRPLDIPSQIWAGIDEGFALGKVEQLRDAVQSSHRILYLLDNAGEVLFDSILIEHLRGAGKRVRVLVRGGGLLHDATPADLADANLSPAEPDPAAPPDPAALPDPNRLPDVLELPPGVLGTPLPPTHPRLKEAITEADLVIAKGSANYETFTAKQAKVPTVVYLLRTKCDPVAQSLGVPVGSLVLLRSAGQPRTGAIKRPVAPPPDAPA